jgi:hypothetical protein
MENLIIAFSREEPVKPFFRDLINAVENEEEAYLTVVDLRKLVVFLLAHEESIDQAFTGIRTTIGDLDRETEDRITVLREDLESRISRLEGSSSTTDGEEEEVESEQGNQNGEGEEQTEPNADEEEGQAGNYVVEVGGRGILPFTGEGTELFTNWVQSLEDVLDLSAPMNAEMKANHLKFYLKGFSRVYFDGLDENIRKDFAQAKTALKAKFEGDRTKAKAEEALGSLYQRGTVSELAVEVRRLVDAATSGDADAVRERKMKGEFIRKLKPELKFEVKMKQPDNFEEALEIAMRVETLLIEREGEKGGSLFNEINELKNMIKQSTISNNNWGGNQNNRGRQNRNQSSRNGTCNFCGIFGHFAKDCRKRMAGMNNNNGANAQFRNNTGQGNAGQNFNRGNINRPAGFSGSGQQANRFAQPTGGNAAPVNRGFVPRQQNAGGSSGWQRQGPNANASANVIDFAVNGKLEDVNLKVKIDELEKGKAALLEQNEKLAKLLNKNGGCRPGSKVSINFVAKAEKRLAPKPGANSTFALFGLLSLSCLLGISYGDPMLCSGKATPSLWKIPGPTKCVIPDIEGKPRNLALSIFKPNLEHYETKAHLCQKIKHEQKYTTDLWGEHKTVDNPKMLYLPVSREECLSMVEQKRCEFGELQANETWYQTHNSAAYDFPGRWEALFEDPKVAIDYNCYLSPKTVTYSYGAESISTNAGISDHCKYESGGCLMMERPHSFIKAPMYLIWEPNKSAACSFLKFANWNGIIHGNIWFSHSREFALTFPENPNTVKDCNHKLVVSDKRFAILENEYNAFVGTREKREANKTKMDEGLVFAGEEASRLQALEEAMREMVRFAFGKAARAICEAANEAIKGLSVTAAGNPTLAARAILGNNFIQARFLTADIFQVWPCTPIEENQITFNRGTIGGDQCYKFLPVLVDLSGKNFTGFLDPVSEIFSKTSPVGSCDQFRFIFADWFGKVIKYDQTLGHVKTVSNTRILKSEGFNFEFTLPEPIIFHAYSIYNFSEIFPSDHFQSDEADSSILSNIRRTFPEVINEAWNLKDLVKVSAKIVSNGIFGFLFGLSFSPMQIWIFLCCIYCTWKVFWEWIAPIGLRLLLLANPEFAFIFRAFLIPRQENTNYPGHTQMRAKNRRQPALSQPRMALSEGAGPIITEMNEFAERDVEWGIGVTFCNIWYDWPPIIEVEIQGIKFRALVDTGSAITIAQGDILNKLNSAEIHPCGYPIVGIGGTQQIWGLLNVEMKIGNSIINGGLGLADFPLFIARMKCYIILGRDFLKELPPMLINLKGKHVSFLDASPADFKEVETQVEDLLENYNTKTVGLINWKEPKLRTLVYAYAGWSIMNPYKRGGLKALRLALSREMNLPEGELLGYRLVSIQAYHARKKVRAEMARMEQINVAILQTLLAAGWQQAGIARQPAGIAAPETGNVAMVDEEMPVLTPILANSEPEDNIEIPALNVGMISMGDWAEIGKADVPKCSAQIVGKINGVNLTLLLDTGSQVTIGPSYLMPALSIPKLDPIMLDMVGVAGQQISISGSKIVEVEVGRCKASTRMFFSQQKPAAKTSEFEVIIGVDVLAQIPPITFDFLNWNVKINNLALELGIGKNNSGMAAQIRAINSAIIPANSEVIVEAYIPYQKGGNESFWLIEKVSRGLQGKLLFTLPAVTELSAEGKCPFLVINPTQAQAKIFEDMTLGEGIKIANVEMEAGIFATAFAKEEAIERDPEFVVDLEQSALSEQQKGKLRLLLDEFNGVFSKNSHDLGICKIKAPTIITSTEIPPKQKPFRAPFKLKEEIREHIRKLIKMGVMRESDTPWVSNLVLVAKKDGTLRPCIDFRKLNTLTVPDYFPLPVIESVLEKIGGCAFYSSLDMSSGYMQIPLDTETSYKCGVITEDGTFQMTAMPFGLKNASGIFSRTMSQVLFGLDEAVISYIDDVLVFTKSPNFDDHLASLRKVFERMREFNLKLSPKKCLFGRQEIPFLGHVIKCADYAPSPRNIDLIRKFPAPINLQQVRRFVGMASFFRRFIPNFSELAQPLTKLTKKVNKFGWNEEQKEAFEKIKAALLSEPVLTYPDYQKEFHIFCDASCIAQAGALMQKDEESGKFRAISFCSRTMTDREQNMPAVYSELGAIIFAIRTFKPFIYMTQVVLHSDHRPLSYLLNKAENPPKINRWLMEIQDINLKIVHISGTKNTVADALSRVEWGSEEAVTLEELKDCMEFPRCLAVQRNRQAFDLIDGGEPCLEMEILSKEGFFSTINMKEEQEKDEILGIYIKIIKGEGNDQPEEKKREAEKFILQNNGCLYLNQPKAKRFHGGRCPIAVPNSLKLMVFNFFHGSALAGCHMGFAKTLKKSNRYWWPTKAADLRSWCSSCMICQMRRNPRPGIRAPMAIVRNTAVFRRVGLDITGPFKSTERENRYVLNIICWFSKFLISVPLPNTRAVTVAKAMLENCVLKHGACDELITDNAAAFTCDFYKEFCRLLGIGKKYTTPYRSQGNASTERSFQVVQDALAKTISADQSNWDLMLPFVVFCYNTSTHKTTRETPYFLMHGRDPLFTIDVALDPTTSTDPGDSDMTEFKAKLVSNLRTAWNFARENSEKAQEMMKKDYDKKANNEGICVGDRVLLVNTVTKIGLSRKLSLPWDKQFRVVGLEHPHATLVSISAPNKPPKRVHLNQIKKCFTFSGPARTTNEPSIEEANDLAEAGAEDVADPTAALQQRQVIPPEAELYKTRSGRQVKPKRPLEA